MGLRDLLVPNCTADPELELRPNSSLLRDDTGDVDDLNISVVPVILRVIFPAGNARLSLETADRTYTRPVSFVRRVR